MCTKKHPQDCLYYTNFNNCKHGEESCKFLHRRNASNHIDMDKYKQLEAIAPDTDQKQMSGIVSSPIKQMS